MNQSELAERSIIKKYRKEIWIPFIAAVKDYRLISPGDRIAVCISGGKDSMLMAKCIQHLQKYSDFPFEARYLMMDPGYRERNRQKAEENAQLLQIPVQIFNTHIFKEVEQVKKSPCYLCARMRRGHLYKQARNLGCNKIALGHHFDDVIETVLMSMLYGGEIKTMMPKLHSKNYPGMELIRPMYRIKEADILAWCRYNGLEFIQCACRLTENTAGEKPDSKRQEMKELICRFRKINRNIDQNIFQSVHDINLETVIGFHCGGQRYSFLDDYEKAARPSESRNYPF